MKVIFLDFDGVITTMKSHYFIDLERCTLIKDICDKTGAKIVISSSWRRHTLEETIEDITHKATEYGTAFPYPEYVIGLTDKVVSKKWAGSGDSSFIHTPRGVEIDKWMNEHTFVKQYVILDDDADMLYHQRNNFIQTDPEKGISEKDKEKAIKILNRK